MRNRCGNFSQFICGESESEAAQWCLTLCDPMDCILPGSSIHGIFQARVLELVAISFSKHGRIQKLETLSFKNATSSTDKIRDLISTLSRLLTLRRYYLLRLQIILVEKILYSRITDTVGQRSLVDYSPWGNKESDMTEQLTLSIGKSKYFRSV